MISIPSTMAMSMSTVSKHRGGWGKGWLTSTGRVIFSDFWSLFCCATPHRYAHLESSVLTPYIFATNFRMLFFQSPFHPARLLASLYESRTSCTSGLELGRGDREAGQSHWVWGSLRNHHVLPLWLWSKSLWKGCKLLHLKVVVCGEVLKPYLTTATFCGGRGRCSGWCGLSG